MKSTHSAQFCNDVTDIIYCIGTRNTYNILYYYISDSFNVIQSL